MKSSAPIHLRYQLQKLGELGDNWDSAQAHPIAKTGLLVVNRMNFRKGSENKSVSVSLPLINALVEIKIDASGKTHPYIEAYNPEVAPRLDWTKERTADLVFDIEGFALLHPISLKALNTARKIYFEPIADGGILVVIDKVEIRVAPDGTFVYLKS